LKAIKLPKIEISFPIVSERYSDENRERLMSIISRQEQIDASLRIALTHSPKNKKLTLNEEDGENLIATYNSVVTDGRYIEEFLVDPGGVADRLKLKLSKACTNAILSAKDLPGIVQFTRNDNPANPDFLPIVAVVIVIVFIVVQIPRDVENELPGSITIFKGKNRRISLLCFDASKVKKL
jgi:hypothetical protein